MQMIAQLTRPPLSERTWDRIGQTVGTNEYLRHDRLDTFA